MSSTPTRPFTTKQSILQLRKDFLQGVNLADHSDVTLKVDSQAFHAHKIILSLRSTFFADLFKNTSDKEVDLEKVADVKVQASSFEIILKYLYNGELLITHENCLDLYSLCRQFKLKSAEEVCNEFLEEMKQGAHVCGLLTCAYQQNEPELYRQCMKGFEEKTEECLESDMFYTLPDKVIEEILKSERIVCTEKQLFDAVIRWWGANKSQISPDKSKEEQDKYLMDNFLFFIRFPLMEPEEIVEIERMKLLPRQFILDAFRHHACGASSIFDDKKNDLDIYQNSAFRSRPRGESTVSFSWNSKKMGSDMKLSNSDLTVEIAKPSISCYQTVIADKACKTKGITVFEIVIDSCTSSSHIMIGISTAKNSLKQWIGQSKDGWSYFGYNGTKYHSGTSPQYANNTKFGKGDVIGVKFDGRSGGSLFFYKNGTPLGVAYSNILKEVGKSDKIYPAVSLRTTNDKVSLRTDSDMKHRQVYSRYLNDSTK